MSILDLDDNVDNVPEFKIGDVIKQYLDDINGIVDPELPFEYVPGINVYGRFDDKLDDNYILVRDNSNSRYYNVDEYYFCNPNLITSSFTMHAVTEIKECIAPGIYKRATWGWIKKHFNIV